MARVVVIGAGAMGLAAAHHAATLGHRVVVLEAGAKAGGMAAHFDLAGLSIERYYHFVCKSDRPTFELMAELGIADRMRWRATSMGYFTGGRLHRWGDPLALLRFPGLTAIEKLRYGLWALVCTRRDTWPALEHDSARRWIERWCGPSVYDKLWRNLFDLKFHDRADDISAAWIWTRIRRVGRSRRSPMQEELGYVEDGSETLVDALARAIEAAGGEIRLGEPALRVVTDGAAVEGVETRHGFHPADAVISTVPTPLVPALVPDLPAAWKARYEAIENIGVVCVVLKLKRSVSPHFWVNVVVPDLPIAGVIEFSNLRPTAETVVYVPYYMPPTHPLWARPDAAFVAEAVDCLRRINGAVGAGDVIAAEVGRLHHAQPVCPPGFAATIPPVETPIAGLQIADTCFYYPEDRGIAESVRLGRQMARAVADAPSERSGR
ncbi:NAD(P)/FAD-dependent oxidoreductase [Oharaeibacter diazotrophicus]|uniref:UDP-galactopyranose mutase n=1 Tax=Oharaeibacter diazotrophicus TaxID=1920512 RepID=A0A4R6RJS1_9HYPH|nr:NAD(P)/FAD-dependent oxidoreductase [Oharaeibacter diazotrophicus]TDP86819.1 UDP-galactopyranose mutase [Oharaeibacter diazotrophicus]BBE71238.1 15-cis-phytoene desaturase [Pleomorphomonas sp. SM30]